MFTGEPHGYASNDPINVADPSGLGRCGALGKPTLRFWEIPGNLADCLSIPFPSLPNMNSTERDWCGSDPARYVQRTVAYSMAAADTLAARHLSDGDEGKENALRHALWANSLSTAFGCETARGYFDRHESQGGASANLRILVLCVSPPSRRHRGGWPTKQRASPVNRSEAKRSVVGSDELEQVVAGPTPRTGLRGAQLPARSVMALAWARDAVRACWGTRWPLRGSPELPSRV